MNAPITTLITFGEIKAPGIRTISALLKKRGWKANIIIYKTGYSKRDVPSEHEEDLLSGLIRDLRTNIVGMSVFSPFYRKAQMLTHRLKRDLDVTVVWGGGHPTIKPDQCAETADVTCLGEGEGPFAELVERTAKGEVLDDIRNLWLRKEGAVKRNMLRPLLNREQLGELPFPDIGEGNVYVINRGRVIQGDPLTGTIEYNTLASRGCPFRCSGCINSVLIDLYHDVGPSIRIKSPEYVVSEIVHALNRCPSVKRIRFHEMFAMNVNWVEQFCNEYMRRVRLPFMVASHPNLITESAIRMLREAGLMVVALGMQSPCPRVRREIMNRWDTNEKIAQCVKIMHKYKIDVSFDMIVDNPYENDQDKAEGLEYLLSLPKPFTVHPFSLAYFPTHTLTERALADGVIGTSRVEGLTSQGWFRRIYDWTDTRSDRDAAWNCLYILASRCVVPAALTRFLSTGPVSARKRRVLEMIGKATLVPENFVIVLRRLLRGQLKLLNLMRVIKAKAVKDAV